MYKKVYNINEYAQNKQNFIDTGLTQSFSVACRWQLTARFVDINDVSLRAHEMECLNLLYNCTSRMNYTIK